MFQSFKFDMSVGKCLEILFWKKNVDIGILFFRLRRLKTLVQTNHFLLEMVHMFLRAGHIYVTGSGKKYIVAYIFKIELLTPRGRVSSQL